MTMAVAPFFFQILLAGWKGAPSGAVNQSVFVEVSPEMISLAPVSGEKEKREHEFAEEIAHQLPKKLSKVSLLLHRSLPIQLPK